MVKNKTRGFQWRDVEESEVETMSKFELGQVVMTRTINETIAQNEQFAIDVINAMAQYRNCDWGVTCEEDAEMNDNAVEYGDDRIFASYDTCEGNIWIITEWDRSATTILFPQEYQSIKIKQNTYTDILTISKFECIIYLKYGKRLK